MPITDYNKKKQLDVDSVSGTPSVGKAQPLIVKGEGELIDDFEDGDIQGWSGDTGSFTAQQGTVLTGSYSGELNSSNELVGVSHALDNTSKRDVRFEIEIDNQTGNADDEVSVDIVDGIQNIATLIFEGDGSTTTQGGSSFGSWNANTTLEIRVEPDFLDNSYNLYVDGQLQIENQSFIDSNASTIDEFRFDSDTSNSGGTVNTYVDEIFVGERGLLKESDTGTGDVVIDFTNISDAQDIAVYDQNGNLLDYEIEDLDTTNETGVLWCYNSWVRDGTTQAQIAYGSNSANVDRQNVTGTWNTTDYQASYPLNESSGQTIDRTSNDTDSLNTVGTNYNVSGQFNGARGFDGTDDYIEISDPDWFENQSFTVEFWVNLDSIPSNGDKVAMIAPGYDGNQDPPTIWYDNNNLTSTEGIILREFDGNSSPSITTGFTFSAGQRYHVFIKYDPSANTGKIFIDGTEQGSGSLTGNTPSNTKNYAIGAEDVNSGGISQSFVDGTLDNITVYTGAEADAFAQAGYDASPKAGQVFFSQQAAEDTAITQSGVATGTASLTGDATSTNRIGGAATGSATITGDATATQTINIKAQATGSGSLNTDADMYKRVSVTGTGNTALNGDAIASLGAIVSASATATASLNGDATATKTLKAIATGNADLNTDASGSIKLQISADGNASFTGTGTASKVIQANADGSASFTTNATASKLVPGLTLRINNEAKKPLRIDNEAKD